MVNKRTPLDYYDSLGSRIGYRVLLGGTKHFGLFGPDDSRWNFAAGMRRMEDMLARSLDLPPGSKVLDAGCGVGDVSQRLASAHGHRVVGIDIQADSIAEAKRRASKRGTGNVLEFYVMSYDDLGFDDNSFDGVFTMETLVHAEDAIKPLAEFMRVLRPGGKLALFEYSHDRDLPEDDQAILETVNYLVSMPSFQKFNEGVLEQLLTETGFEDVSSTDITEQMLPMVKSFAQMAAPAYRLFKLIRRPTLSINVMSAVELWNMRSSLHYRVYTATKPSNSSS